MADKDERLECPRCLKKKMVYKGTRFLTRTEEQQPLGALSRQAGPEPLKLYTCKKCGYCELYAAV